MEQAMHYHRPSSVAEAVKLAGTHSDDHMLAGGQTLLPAVRLGLLAPTGWIDLAGIAELRGIRVDGDDIVIGSMTTHEAVCRITRRAQTDTGPRAAGGRYRR